MSYVRVFAICSFATPLAGVCCWPRWIGLLSAGLAISIQAQQPADMAVARQAMETKQYDVAEEHYRKALAQNPSSAEVLTDLGLSLQMQGRSADAIHYFSLALKQRYVAETYALLAQERCRMGDLDRLRPMLARIYREERKNLRVISAVAPCYLDIDEPVESATVYRSLLNTDMYSPDLVLVQLAKSYIRSGQFFTDKLSKAPGSEPFLAALRQAADSGSAGARSAFPEAARISPNFRPGLDWPGAVDLWQQHPQDTALLYLLSVLSAEEGMRQIQVCGDRFPDSPYLQQFYADVLADRGHGDEAIAQYEQLVREHPDLSDIHYSLGLLHEKRDEWVAAEEAFRQQLAAYPTDERAAAHLSKCMLQMEQYPALREFLAPKIRAEHPPQWASLAMAEAEQELGDTDAAIKVLVAVEQDPNADKLVHYRLMHLYSISGRSADAKREYAIFRAAGRN
jgi:tetratricopeptide (TPR) repeat protein